MICRFLEKINCDRFYTFQCPTPFKRQRRDVGRVKRTIIPEAMVFFSKKIIFFPMLLKKIVTWFHDVMNIHIS
jgi:hypothetical protein